jgi:hypothetical protein
MLRGVVKAILIALTAVFALGVLCMALAVALVAMLRYVLTGRKPAVFATFTRFNQTAQQFRPGRWPGQATGTHPDSGDVVDVQAHEVRAVLGAPPPKTAD